MRPTRLTAAGGAVALALLATLGLPACTDSPGSKEDFCEQVAQVPSLESVLSRFSETDEEVLQVMRDLRANDVEMLTLGQYLQPSRHHLPVERFVHPDEFDGLGEFGRSLGFTQVASGPLVRSSYHADQQAADVFKRRETPEKS